jgi:hypothetical protein
MSDIKETNKDSIKVAVRVRDMNKNELSTGSINVINTKLNAVTITDPVSNKSKDFGFDYVFPTNATNEDVYKSIGSDIVASALEGYNCCILAYGQTGTGKTYTMLNYDTKQNNQTNPGLIPRIANELILHSNSLPPNKEIQMEASFIEIYAEKIYDLLAPTQTNLKLHINPKIGTYIENLSTIAVSNIDEVMKIIEKGFKHRSTSSTAMNEQSSRSHAIFTITFKQITYSSSDMAERKIIKCKTSKISLVDLAGSERVKTSKVSGVGFQEAISINKSLSMLSTVFSELVENGHTTKARNSILTALLADSISGNSKTVIIANISPSSISYEISLQTLFYVHRTKKISVHAKINEVSSAIDVSQVNELKSEIERLQIELEHAKSSHADDITLKKLKDELLEYERLYKEANTTWADKLQSSLDLINKLENESKSAEINNYELTSNLQALENENKNLTSEKEKLASALQLLDSDNKKFISILKLLELEKEKLVTDLQALENENKNLTSEKEKLASTLQLLDSDNKKLASTLQLLDSDNKKLASALQLLDSDNKKLASALQLLDGTNKKLTSEKEKLELALQLLDNDKKKLTSEKEKLVTDLQILDDTNKKLVNKQKINDNIGNLLLNANKQFA